MGVGRDAWLGEGWYGITEESRNGGDETEKKEQFRDAASWG